MKTKPISRNEIFAKEIALINQETKQAGHDGKYSDYIEEVISKLKEIDNQFFTNVLSMTNKEFEESKFYLGKSANDEAINQEIIENIKSQLYLLKELNIQEGIDKKQKVQTNFLDDDKYYFSNLQDLHHNTYLKLQQNTNKYKNLELVENNFSKIAKASIKKEVNKTSDNISKKSINELVKECKEMNLKKLSDLDRKKQIYQIKFRWFSILSPIFVLIMVISIILPIYV
ncbi:Hypothetical protein, predicted transmembrane protein [Mycoplasma yeatsii 13926]|uniref:Transmembrane protein n=1 Tax=Mycoplasma yeatsii 13926 TaxID=1188240 RepID=S6G428_9MOLU|nr:hypothetical protein [Mycoplasma yeatsii]EOA07537.1 Hypothetical protein, predicted transmembrane protein [Mycoplasma yeatsii 13926]